VFTIATVASVSINKLANTPLTFAFTNIPASADNLCMPTLADVLSSSLTKGYDSGPALKSIQKTLTNLQNEVKDLKSNKQARPEYRKESG
jgi:predicted MPP superfamily phosphohydrolase